MNKPVEPAPNPIVTVGEVRFGNALPLALIAGPCALESRNHAIEMASALKEIADRVALGFVYSGYFAETFRAGIQSIPKGHIEAGRACGMPERLILRRIVLPQVVRRMLPEASLGTDVIAGFPGESEADFEQGRALLDDAPFTYFHVFPYSRRSGTTAAKAKDPVPPAAIRVRAAVLRRLDEDLQVGACLRLAGEIVQRLRAQGRIDVLAALFRRKQSGLVAHAALFPLSTAQSNRITATIP